MDMTIKKGAAASGFYLMRRPRIYIRPLYRGIAFYSGIGTAGQLVRFPCPFLQLEADMHRTDHVPDYGVCVRVSPTSWAVTIGGKIVEGCYLRIVDSVDSVAHLESGWPWRFLRQLTRCETLVVLWVLVEEHVDAVLAGGSRYMTYRWTAGR